MSFVTGFLITLKIAVFVLGGIGIVLGILYVIVKLLWKWKSENSVWAFIALVILTLFVISFMGGVLNSTHKALLTSF